MSGTVTVGSTPVQLNNIDLHAYIVVGDGRAYTAISEVGVLKPILNFLISIFLFSPVFHFLFSLICNVCSDWAGARASGLGSHASCTNRRAVWMAVCSGAAQ